MSWVSKLFKPAIPKELLDFVVSAGTSSAVGEPIYVTIGKTRVMFVVANIDLDYYKGKPDPQVNIKIN